jgi:hypothetical protein
MHVAAIETAELFVGSVRSLIRTYGPAIKLIIIAAD